MTMQEVGEVLRSARLGKGLTLEEVNERTKISLYVLEALEKGETERLPHPVYAKGFVKAYARLLGLDEADMLKDYLVALGPMGTLEIDPGVSELKTHGGARGRAGKIGILLVLICLLAVGGWLIFSFISQKSAPAPADIHEMTSVDRAPLSETAVPEQGTDPGFTALEEENGTVPVISQEAAAPEENPEVGSEESPAISLEAKPGATDIAEQPGDTPPPAERVTVVRENQGPGTETDADESAARENTTTEHVLVVTARRDCWLRVVANGDVKVRVLHPGERLTVAFTGVLEIKLGDAGGVDFAVDGHPYAFEARSGEVKTLQINARDL